MTTPTIVSYLRWKRDVAEHDYTAASSYLSIRFGQEHADEVAAKLRKLPVTMRRANDILRATGRDPLPLSDPGVLKDLKKVLGNVERNVLLKALIRFTIKEGDLRRPATLEVQKSPAASQRAAEPTTASPSPTQ